MHRLRLLPVLVVAALGLCLPAAAAADPYLPPPGKVFNGVTAGHDIDDFQSRTGKHPAVWQHFIGWGGSYAYTIANSRHANARLMLHIGTSKGQNMPESISPGAIARGHGDGFLVGLARNLAALGSPAYVRLLGEMNNCNNPYAAYSCNGARRDADHSQATFKQAWKRAYLILHGGDVAAINQRLAALHLPAVQAGGATLPVPQVAFVWAPMTGGAPNIGALRPQAYWPGGQWVDWVGTSFYSRFPNFAGLEPFYKTFAVGKRKPFAIAEWAIWGADAPDFATRLFRWVASHRRVRMMSYNQGAKRDGIFRLSRYPRSTSAIRKGLASPRFVAFAAERR